MRIVRLVKLFVFLGALVLTTVPSIGEAGCPACSGIGQSNGYYANPSSFGAYRPIYGYPAQFQPQAVRSKPAKSKKRSPKQKPAAQ
jgi:hypothetical protein